MEISTQEESSLTNLNITAAKLKEMLSTPTNNFGLALLFKNFVLIDLDYQKEEVCKTKIFTHYKVNLCPLIISTKSLT